MIHMFFLTHILERKLTCKKIIINTSVWDGLILRFKDLDLVIQGLDRLYEIY